MSSFARSSRVDLLSQVFVRTLRDDPAEAETANHRLLLRGGYARRSASGIYSYLPLGLRVLRRIEAVVREEMAAAGCQAELAPYDVEVIPLGRNVDEGLVGAAADALAAAGLTALVDDRPGASAGVRFADADLIGCPFQVVLGRRAADGIAELRTRDRRAVTEVALADLPRAIAELRG